MFNYPTLAQISLIISIPLAVAVTLTLLAFDYGPWAFAYLFGMPLGIYVLFILLEL